VGDSVEERSEEGRSGIVSCALVKGIEEYITSGDWSEKVTNFSAKYSSDGRHIGDWAYIRAASTPGRGVEHGG